MATITHRGNEVHTSGNLPQVGQKAPDFKVTGGDLKDIALADFAGKRLVLNIFPSIDTGTCAASVRRFNQEAAGLNNTVVLNVSKDLPFAQKRFCAAEGIENVVNGSEYKNDLFSSNYRVVLSDGALAGLFSRAVVVVDSDGTVIHTEQVPEIGQEPDYEAVIKSLK
ncbi:MAG: thiol peroxidase [Flavobacteriales bacterium]